MHPPPNSRPRRAVIAIVDDDPRLLVSLGDFLESSGYLVRSYSSAIELLEGDALNQVDCLITDIDMPAMDGVELQQTANDRRPELPVIFITGRPDLVTQRRIEKSKRRLFQKPFDTKTLLAAVADVLSRRDD